MKKKPNNNYTIGIVGYGYVGQAIHRIFKGWDIKIFSPNFDLSSPKEEFKDADLTIISVPTAMKESGQCDTSIVEESVKWLTEQNPDSLILIKSTVEPGTTDRLKKKYNARIVFSPEYVGEGKYYTPPWKYPDPVHTESHGFMVMGGDQKDMEDIAQIFVRKMGPHTRFTFLDAKEAEFVKYWENLWGATKVIFANQMYDAAQAMGVNFYKAREGWIADPRVEPMHTAVFEKARGFSGKCFPKDMSAFIYSCEQHGFDPTLLKEVWNINARYRPEEFGEKQ